MGLEDQMKPLVIIDEHRDVIVYATVAAAELAMEPIDVLSNEYVAYDCEGFRLKLAAGHNRVSIDGRTSETPSEAAVAALLRGFIERASGRRLPAEISSLDALLKMYIEQFGYAA